MRLKTNTIWLLILIQLVAISCTGFSKTGRKLTIENAQKEATKKEKEPTPETIVKDSIPKIKEIKDVVTIEESKKIKSILDYNKIKPAKGKLVQVEGLVFRELTILLADLNTSINRLHQITELKKHVQKNWRYIYDPAIDQDTWRSAEATISLKYKGKYPGDCDDFAILLASFCKQIGLKARVIGGYDANYGHAFAEFEIEESSINSPYLKGFDIRKSDNRHWVSLDWFSGYEHNKFIKNTKILIEP